MDDDLARLEARNTQRAALLAQVQAAYPELAAAALATGMSMAGTKATFARRRPVAAVLLRRWLETHGKRSGWPDHGSLTLLLNSIEEDWWWRWLRLACLLVGTVLIVAGAVLPALAWSRANVKDWSLQLKFWNIGEFVIDPWTLAKGLVASGIIMLIGAIWLRWRNRRDATGFARALEADLYRIVFGGGGARDSLVSRMVHCIR